MYYGDANSNGMITTMDILYIDLMVRGIRPVYVGADANVDGRVTSFDILIADLIVRGLRTASERNETYYDF